MAHGLWKDICSAVSGRLKKVRVRGVGSLSKGFGLSQT